MKVFPTGLASVSGLAPSEEATPAWQVCSQTTDRSAWHPEVRQFFEYWLRITPSGSLPGRQHFDVLDIPTLMPRVWLLDVLQNPRRYRFRLAGTKKVESIGREVTGQMFDEAHPPSPGRDRTCARFDAMVATRIATHRRGLIGLEQDKARYHVENCMVPFARDGETVDMIGVLSVVFNSKGLPI